MCTSVSCLRVATHNSCIQVFVTEGKGEFLRDGAQERKILVGEKTTTGLQLPAEQKSLAGRTPLGGGVHVVGLHGVSG